MEEGRSVATTMGFTALEGVMMGRRSGSIDPGLVLHLLEQEGMTVAQVHQLLYRQSGLLGVSGLTNDMRDLLASDDPRAAEAVDLFCRRVVEEIGALAAAMGGLDALVFTGGIGQNAAPVRERIASALGWLGAKVDKVANEAGEAAFDAEGSRIALRRIPTDEQVVIARAVREVLDL